jgi:hypothetical protein
MVSIGFSVIIGSWKTIEMLLPRIFRSSPEPIADEFAPFQLHRPGFDPAGRVDQADDREAGDALARAGLADEAHDLAALGDAVDRLYHAGRGCEGDAEEGRPPSPARRGHGTIRCEVGDFEKTGGVAHRFSLGLT